LSPGSPGFLPRKATIPSGWPTVSTRGAIAPAAVVDGVFRRRPPRKNCRRAAG
jgi:hypothetical protein